VTARLEPATIRKTGPLPASLPATGSTTGVFVAELAAGAAVGATVTGGCVGSAGGLDGGGSGVGDTGPGVGVNVGTVWPRCDASAGAHRNDPNMDSANTQAMELNTKRFTLIDFTSVHFRDHVTDNV
jgi:hypothetical protein